MLGFFLTFVCMNYGMKGSYREKVSYIRKRRNRKIHDGVQPVGSAVEEGVEGDADRM